jgi:hypothetical protein
VDILFVEFGKHVELILQPLGQDVIILGLQLLLALLHCSMDYYFNLLGSKEARILAWLAPTELACTAIPLALFECARGELPPPFGLRHQVFDRGRM